MTTTSSRISKLFAGLAVIALLSSPALAASSRSGPETPAGAWSAAPFLGLDIPTFNGTNVGPRLGGQAMYSFGQIAENLTLDVGPRVAWTYNGGDASLWTVDFLATGRVIYAATPKLGVSFQTGLGFGFYHTSGDNGGFFDILLAPGVVYALTPSINLLGEVGLWINAKNGLGTHVAIPTIGAEWRF